MTAIHHAAALRVQADILEASAATLRSEADRIEAVETTTTDGLLDVREVAERLHLGVSTVQRMLLAGELHGTKVRGQWRVPAASLDAVLQRGVS